MIKHVGLKAVAMILSIAFVLSLCPASILAGSGKLRLNASGARADEAPPITVKPLRNSIYEADEGGNLTFKGSDVSFELTEEPQADTNATVKYNWKMECSKSVEPVSSDGMGKVWATRFTSVGTWTVTCTPVQTAQDGTTKDLTPITGTVVVEYRITVDMTPHSTGGNIVIDPDNPKIITAGVTVDPPAPNSMVFQFYRVPVETTKDAAGNTSDVDREADWIGDWGGVSTYAVPTSGEDSEGRYRYCCNVRDNNDLTYQYDVRATETVSNYTVDFNGMQNGAKKEKFTLSERIYVTPITSPQSLVTTATVKWKYRENGQPEADKPPTDGNVLIIEPTTLGPIRVECNVYSDETEKTLLCTRTKTYSIVKNTATLTANQQGAPSTSTYDNGIIVSAKLEDGTAKSYTWYVNNEKLTTVNSQTETYYIDSDAGTLTLFNHEPGSVKVECEVATGSESATHTEKTDTLTVYFYRLDWNESGNVTVGFINDQDNSIKLTATLANNMTKPFEATYQWFKKVPGSSPVRLHDNKSEGQDRIDGATTNSIEIIPISSTDNSGQEYYCRLVEGGADGVGGTTIAETKPVTVYVYEPHIYCYAAATPPADGSAEENLQGAQITPAGATTQNLVYLVAKVNDLGGTNVELGNSATWQWANVESPNTTLGSREIDPAQRLPIHQEKAGVYRYRCTVSVPSDANNKTRVLTLSRDIEFYGASVTCNTRPAGGYLNKDATIVLGAELNPKPTTPAASYDWILKPPSGATVEEKNGDSEWQIPQVVNGGDRPAGTYQASCTIKSSNGVVLGTASGEFTLYDADVTVKGVTHPNWIEVNDYVELRADVKPSDKLGDAVYTWEVTKAENGVPAQDPAVWTPVDGANSEYQQIKVSNAGEYIYRCSVTGSDGTRLVQEQTPDSVKVYGIEFTVLDEDNNEIPITSEGAKVEAGRPFTVLAEAIPATGTGSQYDSDPIWYVDPNGKTIEENEEYIVQPGTTGYQFPGNLTPGTSRIVTREPDIGRFTYACGMRSSTNSAPTLYQELFINSQYKVSINADWGDNDKIEGATVQLAAQVANVHEQDLENIEFRWTTDVGGLPTNATGDEVTATVAAGAQKYTVRLYDADGDLVGEETLPITALYALALRATPAEGRAEAKDDAMVTIVANLPNAEPNKPMYVWQKYNEASSGTNSAAKADDPWETIYSGETITTIRVPASETKETTYQCLLGEDGVAPESDTDESLVGIDSMTVGGYKLTLESDLEKPDEPISAGSAIELRAEITPNPPADATYTWEVETDTASMSEIPGSKNKKQIRVTPAEGGSYRYQCRVALANGETAAILTDRVTVTAKQGNFRVTVTTDPAEGPFPLDKPFCLIASVNKNPDDTATYQWQVLNENGWEDLSRSDANQEKMTILPSEEGETTYRCEVVVTSDGKASDPIYSDLYTVRVTENGADVDNSGSDSWDGQGGQISALVTGSRDFQITRTTPAYVWGHGSEIDKTTAADVTSAFAVPAGQTMDIRRGSTVVQPGEQLCTGDILYLYDANQQIIDQATVVVLGDVLGKGTSSVSQIVCMASHISGKKLLRGAYLEAADMNLDGRVSVSDLTILASKFKEKSTKRSA